MCCTECLCSIFPQPKTNSSKLSEFFQVLHFTVILLFMCLPAFNFHGSLYSKNSIDFLKVRYHIFCYFQPKMLCQYKSEKIWSLIAPNVCILERTERSQDVQVCVSIGLSYGRFYSLYLSASNYLLT